MPVLIIVAATTAVMAVALLVAFFVVLLLGLASVRPEQRFMRERRRHTKKTLRSMRRMTAIKEDTLRRMYEAERRGHHD